MAVKRLTLILAVAVLAPAAHAATSAADSSSRCHGLRLSYRSGGATFSALVVNLRADDVSCATARDLAAEVDRRILHDRPMPARIDGFRVRAKANCQTCAPVWRIRAFRLGDSDASVTFTVLGGA